MNELPGLLGQDCGYCAHHGCREIRPIALPGDIGLRISVLHIRRLHRDRARYIVHDPVRCPARQEPHLVRRLASPFAGDNEDHVHRWARPPTIGVSAAPPAIAAGTAKSTRASASRKRVPFGPSRKRRPTRRARRGRSRSRQTARTLRRCSARPFRSNGGTGRCRVPKHTERGQTRLLRVGSTRSPCAVPSGNLEGRTGSRIRHYTRRRPCCAIEHHIARASPRASRIARGSAAFGGPRDCRDSGTMGRRLCLRRSAASRQRGIWR